MNKYGGLTFPLISSMASLVLLSSVAHTEAASVTISGGGTNSQPVYITIPQDVVISSKPGESFGGYYMGFKVRSVMLGRGLR